MQTNFWFMGKQTDINDSGVSCHFYTILRDDPIKIARALILRRITQHVQDQNWTAIAIDFVIVVAGVFVGIQVSNWNEVQKVRAGEQDFLARLAVDLAVDIAREREKTEFLEASGAAGLRSLAFIDRGESCNADCRRVVVDFFAASQWRELSQSRVTLGELRASPYPYNEALKRDIIDHYLFIGEADRAVGQPEYRKLVRSLIPAAVQETLWTECFAATGGSQRIRVDCALGVSNETARAIAEAIRQEAQVERTLTFYASMVNVVARTMRGNMPESERLLARVRAEAGLSPSPNN